VFLDRDGVVTRTLIRDGKPYAPRAAAEMEIEPEAAAALVALKAAGFFLVLVTNQPDVARGLIPASVLEEMHARLRAELPLDAVYVCPHDDRDRCPCRKPQPGMLLEAARAHAIDPARSYMIGDRWRDVEAGQRAGCRTVWIDRGYDERQPAVPPDARVLLLPEAAAWILRRG
jgi:D-glycero-D-manno-heptose 1,7-bisphosphate phosphatase